MSSFVNQENRPLKKPRLGNVGPEVYPQDRRQKEDDLSPASLKHGFSYPVVISEEFGSAKDLLINNVTLPSKIFSSFSSMLVRKQEINTFQEVAKKKPLINTKDNFYPIGISKNKQLFEPWLRDDLASNKPLATISKKIPIFNKKEEIFMKLCDENVPLFRAVWFIKMTNAYNMALSETAKSKKRQVMDPYLDWTLALTRHLREQLLKISDHLTSTSTNSLTSNNVSKLTTSFLTAGGARQPLNTNDQSIDANMKHWSYSCRLASFMYEEGMLERHEFLMWMLEQLERFCGGVKTPSDENILKMLLTQIVKYVFEFTQSQMLARKLAHFCCRKLSLMSNEGSLSTHPSNNKERSGLPVYSVCANCPQHRGVVMVLSSLLHAVMLACPGALVWHRLIDTKASSHFNGSPLDFLHCPPSLLPMPYAPDNDEVREMLKMAEDEIVHRSMNVELKWSVDKHKLSNEGTTISHLLSCLEALDQHNFERVDNNHNIDSLFQQLFNCNRDDAETQQDPMVVDEALVTLLCEWVVSSRRRGSHRAVVVAVLLEKYQTLLSIQKGVAEEAGDSSKTLSQHPLQHTLFNFLDQKAPYLSKSSSQEVLISFTQLICLFSELIRLDIFSHDAYVCFLISRGDLMDGPAVVAAIQYYHVAYLENAATASSGGGNVSGMATFGGNSSGAAGNLLSFASAAAANKNNKNGESVFASSKGEKMDVDSDFSLFGVKEGPRSQQQTVFPPRTPGAPMTPVNSRTPPHAAPTPSYPSTPNHPPSHPQTPNPYHPLTPNAYHPHTPNSGGSLTPGKQQVLGGTMMGLNSNPAMPSIMSPYNNPMQQQQQQYQQPFQQQHMMTHQMQQKQHLQQQQQQPFMPMPSPTNHHHAFHPLTPNSQLTSLQSNNHLTTKQHLEQQQHTPQQHTPQPVTKPLKAAQPPKMSYGSEARHILYLLHFPVNSSEPCCHENNQRAVVLSGFGKSRDEVKHTIRKTTKELCRLFGRKSCLDVSTGEINGKGKKKKDKDLNPESMDSVVHRFQRLSFHAQHIVTHVACKSLTESFTSFISGCCQLLPTIEHTSLLFDLLEHSLNITLLLTVVVKLLSELPEIDSNLKGRGSVLAASYASNLAVCAVAVLRSYHSCFLLQQDNVAAVFDSLSKLVSVVHDPSDCSSAQRCVLAYLYELFNCCSFVKSRYAEQFGGVYERIKEGIMSTLEPSTSNLIVDESFSRAIIDNPKKKVDAALIEQLNKQAVNRYSFVCSTIIHVCTSQLPDSKSRVYDLALTCAQVTALCRSLCCEWLGVFKALCWSSNHNCGFNDVLTQVDVGDLSINNNHDSLATFACVLLGYQCFSLEEFIKQVALQSLLAPCRNVGSGGDPDCEQGARLTCHLLLNFFHMVSDGGSVLSAGGGEVYVRCSKDRRLIEAAVKKISVKAMVAVIKALLMLGDNSSGDSKKDYFVDSPDSHISINRIKENSSLSEYARHCLTDVCSQAWVREKFLKKSEQLLNSELLLDRMLSHKQARELVSKICYPGRKSEVVRKKESGDEEDDEEDEEMEGVGKILKNTDLWKHRVSWLELQMMVLQATPPELDNIARGIIEVFQQDNHDDMQAESVWCIAPLISKMSPAVQGRVLKVAGSVLEIGSQFWAAKNIKDKEKYLQKSTFLLANQCFLNVVLSCLGGQNDQREVLLRSLHDQLEKFVTNSKEQQDRGNLTDDSLQNMLQDALLLRLSLVGHMFDTIQRNNSLVQDWCLLLMQLVSAGIVELQNHGDLLKTVADMMVVLIHGTIDPVEKVEESRKVYQNLIRKLKKELGEKRSDSIDVLRQLLPLSKTCHECVVCEFGPAVDSKPSKHQEAVALERNQNLQLSRKERVNVWEMIEGQKNPAPINLSWFAAVKRERRMLRAEEQHRLLLYHSHTTCHPDSYFLEPPSLPNDEELPSEKVPSEMPHTPCTPQTQQMQQQQQHKQQSQQQQQQMDFETSKEGSKGKKTRSRSSHKKPSSRTPTIPQTPNPSQQQPNQQHYINHPQGGASGMSFNRPEMYPPSMQQWYPNPPFNNQLNQGGVPSRGYTKGGPVPPNGVPNPRQMLNNVLKTRHPLQNNNQQNPSQPFLSQQQQMMWARGARPAVNRPVRLSMYSSQPQTAPQPNPSQHFPSQGYPGYGASGMEGGAQGSMGYQQVSQYPANQYPQGAGRYMASGMGGGGYGAGMMRQSPQTPNFPANIPASQQQRFMKPQLFMQQQQQQQLSAQQQQQQLSAQQQQQLSAQQQQQQRIASQNMPFNSFQ